MQKKHFTLLSFLTLCMLPIVLPLAIDSLALSASAAEFLVSHRFGWAYVRICATRVCVCASTCEQRTCACVHAYVCANVRANVCACACVYSSVDVYRSICLCLHAHTCIRVHV